jgi:Fe2+ or Zn2+ uptake regulation protein
LAERTKLRETQQRKIILEELKKTSSHPTADELFQKVRSRLPKISLGTVYRNLELLSDEGIIKKIELAGTQRRYDGNTNKHYHIRCIYCNRVDDIKIKYLANMEKEFFATTDYKILGHRLEFIGVCPQCKEKVNSKNRKQK